MVPWCIYSTRYTLPVYTPGYTLPVITSCSTVMQQQAPRCHSDGLPGSVLELHDGWEELGTPALTILLLFGQSDDTQLPRSVQEKDLKIGCHEGRWPLGTVCPSRCAEWCHRLVDAGFNDEHPAVCHRSDSSEQFCQKVTSVRLEVSSPRCDGRRGVIASL